VRELITKFNKYTEMKKTIYNLELNETLHAEMKWGVRTDIIRVPSGWIYQFIKREQNGKDKYIGNCFVPYDNTFQRVPK
jgi:hypothetical protein